MTTGYTRQSSAEIVAGLAIDAVDLNNEFNQLASTFDTSTGHDHSGSVSGTGAKISLLNSITGILPPANGGVPPGAVMQYIATSAPTGWLSCDGSAVNRTTYAALFAVIGTTFGIGDGSSTFNLPDCRGRVIAGYDAGNATARLTGSTAQGASASSIANTGGEQEHTLNASELAAHTHSVSDPGHIHTTAEIPHTHTINDPKHSHTYVDANAGPGVNGVPTASGTGVGNTNLSTTSEFTGVSNNTALTGLAINGAATGLTVNNSAGGGAHNNTQPTIIMNYIIKT